MEALINNCLDLVSGTKSIALVGDQVALVQGSIVSSPVDLFSYESVKSAQEAYFDMRPIACLNRLAGGVL